MKGGNGGGHIQLVGVHFIAEQRTDSETPGNVNKNSPGIFEQTNCEEASKGPKVVWKDGNLGELNAYTLEKLDHTSIPR